MKRTPIKRVRDTPRRVTGRSDHGPGMEAARAAVMARSRGRCEVQAPGCTRTPTDAHHRLTKRYGPDCPCNLLAVCSSCHHTRIHGEPEVARDLGWIVSRHATTPGAVPVQLTRGSSVPALVLLDCDGSIATLDRRTLQSG